MALYSVQTFYFFKDLQPDQLLSIRAWLMGHAKAHQVLGLVILGPEGLNTTLAATSPESLQVFVDDLFKFFGAPKASKIKESQSKKPPFRRFVVKIREEIVTLGRPEFIPRERRRHLSPQEWDQMLLRDDVVVVDTRNDYEYEIGTFKKAIDLNIKEFTEFPEKIREIDSDKEKPHLIFCTGGIRCEKAIYEMEKQGFTNVYQLDGGILNYMQEFPDGQFEGECFVFDSRVALNKDLQPSEKFSLCPQCGEVGSQQITCRKCDQPAKLCNKCHTLVAEQPEYETCSKNCRYHYSRDPLTKGPQQKQFYHYR
jgi:UPF0176 protein